MTYSKLVQDQISMYESWIEQAKKQDHHARMVERLVAEFPEGHYHTSIFGRLTVTYRLKSAEVLDRMLLWLRGFDYRSARGKDDPIAKKRTFFINSRDSQELDYYQKNSGDFRFEAYFLDEDAECRYVEVGTKTLKAIEEREVPVYELQCDELAVEVGVLAE